MKPIKDFPSYSISEEGKVYSKYTNKYLTPQLNSSGYQMVTLRKNNKSYFKRVHRLVAQVFIPNPDNKPVINHKNGNKLDNKVENLEWTTYSENNQHAYDTGLKDRRNNGMTKLTNDEVLYIRELYATKTVTQQYIANIFNINNATICHIVNNKTWINVK